MKRELGNRKIALKNSFRRQYRKSDEKYEREVKRNGK